MRVARSLDLNDAKRAAQAAEAEAKRNNWPVVIAIVDAAGHLLYLQRNDGAQLGSLDVALGKATTAALFRRPTKDWEERLAEGRLGYLSFPNRTLLEGGVPVVIDGEVVGAIGVSGVKSSEDAQIARAGVAALSAAA
ncbi:MAG: heme-binding protein [Proteobacteria bacterium]|nr:heme-binding protein [Pseudomonadota bacterium]